MVSASLTASKNFPPLTKIWYSPASRIADRTDNGIDSFKAQEKSTIKKARARETFRVISHVKAEPTKE